MAAVSSARWWPPDLPGGGHQTGLGLAADGHHSFPGEGLGQADAVAGGLAHVRVVHQPVHRGGGQGFGHQLIESGRVKVGTDRGTAFLVGGIY